MDVDPQLEVDISGEALSDGHHNLIEMEEERLVRMEDVLHDMADDDDDDDDEVQVELDDDEAGSSRLDRKEFKCEYCVYSTNRRSDLIRHIRVHTGENLHHCLQCDYKTARKSDLQRHQLLHSGQKPFKCGVCQYATSRKTVLLKHMKEHVVNMPRARVILVKGQRVINNNALADSSFSHDPNSGSSSSSAVSPQKRLPKKPSKAPIKMYQCDKCEFVAACRKNFREHRLSHGSEQKWKCPKCGYMTIRKSDMTRHYNIHIDNVFKCNLCDYKTVRQSDFVRHSKTHNKKK